MGFFSNLFSSKKVTAHQKLLRKYASCNDITKPKTGFEFLEKPDPLPTSPSSTKLHSGADKQDNPFNSLRFKEGPFSESGELKTDGVLRSPKSPGRCPFDHSKMSNPERLTQSDEKQTKCPFSQPLNNPYEIPQNTKSSEPTILEILGEDIVELMVEKFYHYNLTDRRTRVFFQGINIERLQRMQTTFLVHLLGGKQINMAKMRAAHRRLLDLNDFHFDAVMKNLMKAAKDLGVSLRLRERILAAAETTRDDVLGRTPAHELAQQRNR